MGLIEDSDEEPKQRKRSEWSRYSNCIGKPSSMFFPEKRGRPSKIPAYAAICSTCPVMNECLNYALVHDEKGIWGNSTESQRNRLKKHYPDFVDDLKQQAEEEGWLERHPVPDDKAIVISLPVVPEVETPLEDWLDAL